MRRFLFAALTFASLCGFAGCGDKIDIDYGQTDNDNSVVFVDSHMTFTYDLKGAITEMVDVNVSTTLPAANGSVTTSTDGTKHIVSIANIKCPTAFDIKFQLVPKENLELDDNTVYDCKLDCNFTIVRRFSDGRYILGNSESVSNLINNTFLGSKAEEFIGRIGTQNFSFGLSADGYYEEIVEE